MHNKVRKMIKCMIFLVFFLNAAYLSSAVIVEENRKLTFPIQFPSLVNKDSFYRVKVDGNFELMHCPRYFIFDSANLKCVLNKETKLHHHLHYLKKQSNCPNGYDGTITNQKNCKTFLNCGHGNEFVMSCNAHLLYNNVTKQCDWPESANCCEFWESNSDKLVTDVQ